MTEEEARALPVGCSVWKPCSSITRWEVVGWEDGGLHVQRRSRCGLRTTHTLIPPDQLVDWEVAE